MITFEELKQIVNTEILFDDLKKNEGVLIFYEKDNISIGISYEDDDEGNDCYIYNLFDEVGEYINIGGKGNHGLMPDLEKFKSILFLEII